MKQDKEMVINEMLIHNYEKYYRMAYSYVHNESDALDIVQESAYKAIFNSQKLREIKYADTWICRIVINEAMELLRKNKRNSVLILEENDVRKEENQVGCEKIDLSAAMESLSAKEKTVVMLRYFEDMSLEQVADVAGEKLSTVKSRLYRALRKMKVNLS
ncbi:MAG: sigma-70 family RNA polymerase sigma factor [Eubacterium sp.]